MSKARSSLGKEGEALAGQRLIEMGYRIIARNYRTRLGEIDIIAEENGTLVFVEVRTCQDSRHGYPKESVTFKKQRQLSRVALEYLNRHQMTEQKARFDVVSILMDGMVDVEVIQDAFELCYGV